jgi:hypothetical protein
MDIDVIARGFAIGRNLQMLLLCWKLTVSRDGFLQAEGSV